MRLFAALLPPEDAVADLDAFLEARREAASFRWTDREHLHLTLAFAGEVPEHRLDDLVDGLASAAARRTAVGTRVAGGGAFPHPAGARVLWAGLELDAAGRREIEALAAGARTAMARAGASVDGMRFHPHVTVARLGRPGEVTPWVRLLDAYAGPRWSADEVALVASHLGEGRRRRPRYEVLDRFPVSGRGGSRAGG